MKRSELRELHTIIEAASHVTKGESDDRGRFLLFKTVCGFNLELIESTFMKWSQALADKANAEVDPRYKDFVVRAEKLATGKNAEKKTAALAVRYKDAIESQEAFDKYYEEIYMTEEVELPEGIKPWDFGDLPEKLTGGYIVALKPVLDNYPKGL